MKLLAVVDVDPVQLASVADHNRFAIGEKRVARQQVAGEAALLIVTCYGILQPLFVAGLQIANAQAGFRFVAGAEDKFRAVGRDDRADAAAIGAGHRIFFAGDAVAAGYLPKGERGVVGEASGALGVVEVLAVAAEGCAHEIECRRRCCPWCGWSARTSACPCFRHLHAGTAVDVVHPELVGSLALSLAGNNHKLTIRSPGRRGQFRLALMCQLMGAGAVGLRDPEVVRSVAIAYECDHAGIG